MIMSKHRAETVLAVLAAAEHLADVAELRSPTKMLTEAIREYREAVESLSKPDLRPGCGAFGGAVFGAPEVFKSQPRSVVEQPQETEPPGRSPSTLTPRAPFRTKFGG